MILLSVSLHLYTHSYWLISTFNFIVKCINLTFMMKPKPVGLQCVQTRGSVRTVWWKLLETGKRFSGENKFWITASTAASIRQMFWCSCIVQLTSMQISVQIIICLVNTRWVWRSYSPNINTMIQNFDKWIPQHVLKYDGIQ